MRLLTLSLLLALATTSLTLHQTQVAANGANEDAKAQTILTQARAALGNEAKLKTLQSLTISGSLRRTMGTHQMEGEIQLDLLLPDKLMKSETLSPMPGIELSTTETLNGTEIWTDSQSGGGGNVVIRRSAPSDSATARAAASQLTRAELTRIWLGYLLNAPSVLSLTYSYAGEAEATDGKADVIEAKKQRRLRGALVPRSKISSPADADLFRS